MRNISFNINRLAWTVRYLRGRQIVGQIRRRMMRLCKRKGIVRGRAVVAYAGCTWPREVKFLPPGAQDNHADAIRQGNLRFLNAETTIGFPPTWDCSDLSKLWQYNLHYFEWLWALGYEDAKGVILDWIEKYPSARGSVGWDPYPTSLRVVNWCGVLWGEYRERFDEDYAFRDIVFCSVFQQVEWLMGHLETHLLGNHYFENGAAIAFVGSCFEGKSARQWLDKGLAILRKEIFEQILPDGMHFELSPMYHSRILYLLAILLASGSDQIATLVKEPLGRMMRALNCLCHPDGQIALLNDSAFGICNQAPQLLDFARYVGGFRPEHDAAGAFSLSDSGYYGWRDGKGTYIICDFGKIGPDYIPGHAHADIFNYELSLRNHRVIVDSGLYDYEASETRRYCRSTAAHNTVEIEGQDQCEMWDVFRVARRGYPQDVTWNPNGQGFELSGWHDGYRRLPGKPIHHRSISWNRMTGITIVDTVKSSRAVEAKARIHFHPDCHVSKVSDNTVVVESYGGNLQIVCQLPCRLLVDQSYFYPGFGIKASNSVVSILAQGSNIELSYQIAIMN